MIRLADIVTEIAEIKVFGSSGNFLEVEYQWSASHHTGTEMYIITDPKFMSKTQDNLGWVHYYNVIEEGGYFILHKSDKLDFNRILTELKIPFVDKGKNIKIPKHFIKVIER